MDNASNPIFNPPIGTKTTLGVSVEQVFRELITRVLKESGKNRQMIAAELSALTGERITKRMLDDWLAPSKGKVRFPASFIKALCEVTGDDRPARAVLPEPLINMLQGGEFTIAGREHLQRALKAIALAQQFQPKKATKKSKQ